MEAKDHSKLRPHFCGITWGDEKVCGNNTVWRMTKYNQLVL